ncbi:MAG: aspartyl/asparaginyl beta-hydroxylase domain-containing protein [Steroidobacteraceae bacterium]|nr:aspartyl/asparaginyl beta-hydroxylase domain-containing protein [Steroidobacteraceae bacterium]
MNNERRDPRALNQSAVQALNAGEPARARALLEEAVAIDAGQAVYWQNLALACNLLGDADAEFAALEKTLALEPYSVIALLQKGRLLERRGQLRKAAAAYHAVITILPPDAQLSPQVRAAVDHARRVVRADKDAFEAFLQGKLQEVRNRHPGARMDRFERCLDALLGKRRVYVQQPTFMNFPHLPAIQFYDRGDFQWLDAVEAAAPAIRSELVSALASDDDSFVPYVANPAGVPLNQWRELNNSPRWSAFYFWRNGERIDANCERCPQTARVLAEAPLLDIPGRAPTAFFSLLKPKTRIPPHTGVANTRLTVHLPLVIPEGCRFRVGSETYPWEPDRAWVFDDTIEHEAWNDSDEPRAILIFDIWNPYLTQVERELVRVVMQGAATFYEQDSGLDGV